MKKSYSNDAITVDWQPELCVHSARCWRGKLGLPTVFNPSRKPWVDLTAADTKSIMKTIENCPSGALSYKIKNMENNNENVESIKSSVIAELSPNGPLLIQGNLTIKLPDGTLQERNKVTAFCRCGASEKKPYCDGSHRKIDFKG